jgi:hypothetical protein
MQPFLLVAVVPVGEETELLEQVGVTEVYHEKSDRCEVASCFS